jgi:hypothetical protein
MYSGVSVKWNVLGLACLLINKFSGAKEYKLHHKFIYTYMLSIAIYLCFLCYFHIHLQPVQYKYKHNPTAIWKRVKGKVVPVLN